MAGFKGQADFVVDAKGRIALPARMRRSLNPAANETLIMIRGFERCIYLYPSDEWEKIEREMQHLNQFRREHRAYIRNITRWVHEDSLDSQGRVLLSKNLMSFAGIEPGQRVAIIGAIEHIEVWNPDVLDEYFASQPSDYESLAEAVMGRPEDRP
jgi:MraZ protein